MKKILGISITMTCICFASPMSYDFNIYGTATTGFWEHNYYTNRSGNLVTHTGKDYQLGNNSDHVKINSYGYGKIIGTTTNLGAVSIRHLMNNGKYMKVNLLHMHNNSMKVNSGDYISKNHYLGNEGNTGLGFTNRDSNTHLHLEVAGQISLAWVETARACPGNGCTNNERTTDFDIGNLQAHYKINSSTEKNIPFRSRIWYDPNTFSSNYGELLAFLSKSYTPSYLNFDVYGIADKTIYGYLNIGSVNIHKVGILARNSKKRSDAENSNTTYNTQKFLAESTSDVIGLSGNSNKYSKGDYLFVPYVNDGDEHRYGYPLKFSFVDEGGFIIDNDKTTYNNGASYSEHLSNTPNANRNTVPGYFLTSKLFEVRANNFNDFVKWSVPSSTNGEYHIYAHIPKGATATDTTYIIRTTDGDKTKKINQASATKEDWIDLGTYSLDSDSYVKLTLRNEDNGQWMAFDAIKFEKLSGTKGVFNGTGSIVSPDKSQTIGGDQDIVALQEGDNSMGSFQWLQLQGYCPNLLIKNDANTNEVDDVLIVRKRWNSDTIESFKTSLPVSIPANITSSKGYNFDTILIKSLTSLSKRNKIRAICKNTVTSSSKNTINTPNILTNDGYKWAGNGSIISQELTGNGIGQTEDIAFRYKDKKSLTIFQWQPSSRCTQLKISGGISGGKSLNGKLSIKKWYSDSYIIKDEETNFPTVLSDNYTNEAFYMIEIKTDKNFVMSKYIYAECK